jgi:hypothetical protein
MQFSPRWLRSVLLVVFAAFVAAGASTAALAANPKNEKRDNFAFFDSRQSTASQKVLRSNAAKLDAEPSAAAASLREALGNEGILSLDPLTSTARAVGRTDGFLTGPSSASAASVALASPVSGLSVPSASPGIDASQALATAKTQLEATLIPVEGIDAGDSAHTTTFTGGDTASLVLFQTVSGTRLAWQTTVNAEQDSFVHVIDAQTNRVLSTGAASSATRIRATLRFGSSIRTPPGRPRPERSGTSTCRRGFRRDRRR